MDLNTLAIECHNVSKSKGWLEETRTFGDLIALMHSELSEALEEFRAGRHFDEIYWKCKNCGREINDPTVVIACEHLAFSTCYFKPEGIPIELADTTIRILQFCGTYKIDIENAVVLKMEYNKGRPHKHGGKKI